MRILQILLISVILTLKSLAQNFEPEIKNKCLTINTPQGCGSGMVIQRYDKNKALVNVILTAGHNVSGLRQANVLGQATFQDVILIQHLTKKDKTIADKEIRGKVVKYSGPAWFDIAVILPMTPFSFFGDGVEFVDEIPELGDKTFIVGNFFGAMHDIIVSEGSYSGYNILVEDSNYDVLANTISPGVSGAGVFSMKNGKCVGMVIRGYIKIPTVALINPTRKIKQWARDYKMEWIYDSKKAIPTIDELIQIVDIDTDKR